ncbi:uncharacterized protein LOC120072165 [Benincasa hispida]|uniref:uncharacterized protein LOC120072165 n=1 Tax=Benincasa hispida TaxID=102211 RepID=UPI0019007A57|nr:uncharacterized protein LOC120072165 [Benincasa hispida]
MDRRCFAILCTLLRTTGGLVGTEVVDVEEMVAMFLHILAHDVKNRVVRRQFVKLSDTVSRHFNSVLNVVLRLHEDCLGALDGTYIKVNVNATDRPRYRMRKGEITTNVLGVYDTNGDFVFVLPGWEDSTADSRVLTDAISRPNGLEVLKGYYYLCDVGYQNVEGFLAPYRGKQYHLSECHGGGNASTTTREFFNMKHFSARNVIETAFGLLKERWAILRGKSYYPMQVQTRMITVCFLLHNIINQEMNIVKMPEDLDKVDSHSATIGLDEINYIESSNEWTQWRDELVHNMFFDSELRNNQ